MLFLSPFESIFHVDRNYQSQNCTGQSYRGKKYFTQGFLITGMEGETRKQSKLKSTEKIMQKFLKG